MTMHWFVHLLLLNLFQCVVFGSRVVTLTRFTTTTICPITETLTTGGRTVTETRLTTSTITKAVKTTVTLLGPTSLITDRIGVNVTDFTTVYVSKTLSPTTIAMVIPSTMTNVRTVTLQRNTTKPTRLLASLSLETAFITENVPDIATSATTRSAELVTTTPPSCFHCFQSSTVSTGEASDKATDGSDIIVPETTTQAASDLASPGSSMTMTAYLSTSSIGVTTERDQSQNTATTVSQIRSTDTRSPILISSEPTTPVIQSNGEIMQKIDFKLTWVLSGVVTYFVSGLNRPSWI